jgi:hypothetical protein
MSRDPRMYPRLLLGLGAAWLAGCGAAPGGSPSRDATEPPPPCACAPGETCVAGACVGAPAAALACTIPPPAVSAAARPIQALALGTHRVGDVVAFDVPAGAASVTIVEQVVSAPGRATFSDHGSLPNSAVPLSVTDARGVKVFDQFEAIADPARAALFFGSLSPGAGTLTLPDTSAGLDLVASGLAAGTWRIVVSDLAHVCSLASDCAPDGGSDEGTYDVAVLVKPGSGSGAIPAAGQIDVTFNLTAAGVTPPLSAATAAADPDLQRLVSSLATLLGRAGIGLGTLKFVDVPPAAAAAVATGVDIGDDSACGELSQLFATAPAGRQANVFLVSTFVSGSSPVGTIIAGIDGAIPGPATLSPNLQSGAAVSAANLRAGRANCGPALALDCGAAGSRRRTCCGADVVAYVAAHELAHFLGLYHVSERNGAQFDPLDDTPTCPCDSCTAAPEGCATSTPAPLVPHNMSVGECLAGPACGGGDNLMFWIIGRQSAGNLTPEQGRVMRANPTVY